MPDDTLDAEDKSRGLILVELARKHTKDPDKPRQDPNSGKIFWEWDLRHPGEEVLVVAGRVVKVYPTVKVRQAIADGILVESRKAETPKPPDVSEVLDQRAVAESINRAGEAAALAAQQDQNQVGQDATAKPAVRKHTRGAGKADAPAPDDDAADDDAPDDETSGDE